MTVTRIARAGLLVGLWAFLAPMAVSDGATIPKAAKPSGGMIQLNAGAKHLSAYLSLPKGQGTHPGIVLVQEWWGLNDWVKQQADSLAARGYVAVAPDLYNGKVAYDEATAHQLLNGMSPDAAMATLRDAADFLRSRDDVRAHSIGVIGWCMGGAYAIRLAAADPGIRACVMYYGSPLTDEAAIKGLQAAVLGNFGGADKGPSPEQVRTFEAALRAAGKKVDFKIYPGAGHAFANVNNPWGGYRAAAAKDAWTRTVRFLTRELKQGSMPKRAG